VIEFQRRITAATRLRNRTQTAAKTLAVQVDADGRTSVPSPVARRRPERLSVIRRRAAVLDQERTFLATAIRHVDVENAFLRAGKQESIGAFVNPVQQPSSPADTFGAPRVGHRHEGIDIFAEVGIPVRATVDGVLRDVKETNIGGRIVYLTSADGTYYYYAHLDRWAPGITDGVSVIAGQILGFLGRTGNAEETPPHLHFEIHPLGGAAINPFPVIRATSTVATALFDAWTVPIATLCREVDAEERAFAARTATTLARPTTTVRSSAASARGRTANVSATTTRPIASTSLPSTPQSTARPTTTRPPRATYGKPVLVSAIQPPPSTTIAPGVCPGKGRP
jgi:murein DD-endopeptidase MepM/ murein hydrolase activator NlpD